MYDYINFISMRYQIGNNSDFLIFKKVFALILGNYSCNKPDSFKIFGS